MKLDWKLTKKNSQGNYWEAEYEAYETPSGFAIATARVFPDTYFPGFFTYETWILDPYLKELGVPHYSTRFAFGSAEEDSAKKVCKNYGCEQAKAAFSNFDIQKLYADAFPAIVKSYLVIDCGLSTDDISPAGRFLAHARVCADEGLPEIVEVKMGEDMSLELRRI